jgi:hypothetical protein
MRERKGSILSPQLNYADLLQLNFKFYPTSQINQGVGKEPMKYSKAAPQKNKNLRKEQSVRKDHDFNILIYSTSKCLRFVNFAFMVCLFALLITASVKESFAKDKRMQQYSKDFKAYPAESPEAVVTAFVEYADLGKGRTDKMTNSCICFGSLIEQGSVPDNSQSLIIKSYEIASKAYYHLEMLLLN